MHRHRHRHRHHHHHHHQHQHHACNHYSCGAPNYHVGAASAGVAGLVLMLFHVLCQIVGFVVVLVIGVCRKYLDSRHPTVRRTLHESGASRLRVPPRYRP